MATVLVNTVKENKTRIDTPNLIVIVLALAIDLQIKIGQPSTRNFIHSRAFRPDIFACRRADGPMTETDIKSGSQAASMKTSIIHEP